MKVTLEDIFECLERVNPIPPEKIADEAKFVTGAWILLIAKIFFENF